MVEQSGKEMYTRLTPCWVWSQNSAFGFKGLLGCSGWKIGNPWIPKRLERRFQSMDLATTHGNQGFPTEQAACRTTPSLRNAEPSSGGAFSYQSNR